MKLSSIETTPNPNCMKLNLDEQICSKPLTLTGGGDVANAPEVGKQLLVIDGIRSVFLASDFITITRESNADWQPILVEAARLLGLAEDAESGLADIAQPEEPKTISKSTPDNHQQNLGEVEVAIQVFRGIPVQVRATGDGEQGKMPMWMRIAKGSG